MDDSEKVPIDKGDYLSITIFDCLRRISCLEKFKGKLIEYRDRKVSQEKLQDFRSDINQNVTIVEEYVVTSYTPVSIGHKFPGTLNHIQVAMFREIFNQRFDGLIVQSAIDHLDMAIGRYKSVRFKSLTHTISPFYWLKRFSFWLSCTFAELFSIEKNSMKFSWVNTIFQIVTFLAAVAGIYSSLAIYFGKPTLWF